MLNGAVIRGIVFNVQKFSLHDGPGIRTIVFLKGCPLSCLWCDNPESRSSKPQLALGRKLCNRCLKCVAACPEHAIALNSKGISIDRRRCTACGRCVEVCYPKALILYGKEETTEQVFEKVVKDRIFYEGSGGGITLSGGEPLRQPEFASALLELCHKRGIHTCIETSGYASSQDFAKVLAFTDYVLFDLKHMDREVHHRYTGRWNDVILANAKVLAGSGLPVVWRMPLIPGVNDTLENIRATARFVKAIGKDHGIEVLPYHRLGVGKYQAIGKRYHLGKPPTLVNTPEVITRVGETFEELGVRCHIV